MVTVKIICSNGDAAIVAENICKLYANSFATIGKSGGNAEVTIESANRTNVIRAVRMLQRLYSWNVQITVSVE